jgi:NTE family protein
MLWPIDMIEDVINTAINALDDFELQAFGNRVIAIPTGSVSTLDFSLTQEQKDFLFNSGYETAKQFFAGNPAGENRFGAAAPRGD